MRILRVAHRVVEGLFVLDLLAIFKLGNLFTFERPTKPTADYMVEFAAHGSTTFITIGEHRLYTSAWIGVFVLFAINALLYLFDRPIEEIKGPTPH